MIQPNEKLLPGNVVMWRNRFYTLTKGDIYSMDYLRNFYSPIPLTPEILVQWCGFIKDEFWWGDGINYFGNGTVDVCFGNEEVSDILDGVYFGQDKIPGITHLHTLQNTVYFLSGEEMPVNIPNN